MTKTTEIPPLPSASSSAKNQSTTDEITIHGYSELFAVSPAVKVYKDGCLCGEVGHCGELKLALERDCHLKFKCMFRSSEVWVKKGEDTHVYLFFNRLTGSLNARKARDDNRQEVFAGKEKSATEATMLSFGLVLGLLAFALFLYIFFSIIEVFL